MARFFNFEGDYFGLNDEELATNFELYGENVYEKPEDVDYFSPLRIVISPSVILMFVTGLVSIFSDNLASAVIILVLDALFVAAQLYVRSEAIKRLNAIGSSASMKFRVIRNGTMSYVEKQYIVPDDILVIEAGEQVPADAMLIEARDVTVDESALTGSSKPAAKYAGAISKSECNPSFFYSGTKLLTGIAVCKVRATGVDTKLYRKLIESKPERSHTTRLDRTVRTTVLYSSVVAAVLTLVLLIISLVTGEPFIDSTLHALSIGLCFIPAGISTVIRAYYLKGVSQLQASGGLVKSLDMIEKLNSLSVLCVEKEGAISRDHLAVREVYTTNEELLYMVAALSCEKEPADDVERAIMMKSAFYDENITDLYSQHRLLKRIHEENGVSGALWKTGGSKLYCIKGAPESILPLCRMTPDELYAVKSRQQAYYDAGWSVIAVACVEASGSTHDVTSGFRYVFCGFFAVSAPLRDSVAAAVKTCKRTGVKVVMLTEDSAPVAESTGKMIGLPGKTITGKMIADSIENNTPLEYDADIYAKVTPEQKLFIIDNIKRQGKVVAMTGTRVSDSDMLELADIGLTIRDHTQGSAYEAADIIMNDENLGSIADMIAAARQIHRNVKRAVSVMISGYIALIMLVVLNLFNRSALMLNPTMVAVLTMVILPVLSLVFLRNGSDLMNNMPPSEFVIQNKINYRFIMQTALYGLIIGVSAIASYFLMYNGRTVEFARSCAFISYGISLALMTLMNFNTQNLLDSIKHVDKAAAVILAVTALLPILLVYIPFVNTAFGLEAIDIFALIISVLSGIVLPAVYILVRRLAKFH